jgi:hypothetical protein
LEIGSHILTLKASDEDKGTNGEVYFYFDQSNVKNTDWRSFNLDSSSGELKLAASLDPSHPIYSVVIVASDLGKPIQMTARTSLTFIQVDETNSSAQFKREEVCLRNYYECDKDHQKVFIRLKEELSVEETSVTLKNMTKINNFSKDGVNQNLICYYLKGNESKLNFKLDKINGILRSKIKLDRESKDKYEFVVKVSENCFCNEPNLSNEQIQICNKMDLESETYDSNDFSQLKFVILVEDVNDNIPKFEKKMYQHGLMADILKGDTLFESYVSYFILNKF